ncbi:MAG: hypothetical protein QOH88_1624 [Verrucomicrobiota bacterium]|jgi:hypothetical protein
MSMSRKMACHPEPRRRRGTPQSHGHSRKLRFAIHEAHASNVAKHNLCDLECDCGVPRRLRDSG